MRRLTGSRLAWWCICLALAPLASADLSASGGRQLLQQEPQGKGLVCPITANTAFQRPYSTEFYTYQVEMLNFTACFAINFKAQLIDVYTNRETNATVQVPYTYSGTITHGTNSSTCATLDRRNVTGALVDWATTYRINLTDVMASSPLARPFLPFAYNDICVNLDPKCTEASVEECADPATSQTCPVLCGTCTTPWELTRVDLGRVLNASIPTCCEDPSCTLYTSEVMWDTKPSDSTFPPTPPAPPPPATADLNCSITPTVAFLSPRTTAASNSSNYGFLACVNLNVTVELEETLRDRTTGQLITNKFYRQGTLSYGSQQSTCSSVNGQDLFDRYLTASPDPQYLLGPLGIWARAYYFFRTDGPNKPADVCYDDLQCSDPDIVDPCASTTLLGQQNLCPLTCNTCTKRLELVNVTIVRSLPPGPTVTACCDTNAECTNFTSVIRAAPASVAANTPAIVTPPATGTYPPVTGGAPPPVLTPTPSTNTTSTTNSTAPSPAGGVSPQTRSGPIIDITPPRTQHAVLERMSLLHWVLPVTVAAWTYLFF